MIGSLFVYGVGCICSNDAEMLAEKIIIRDENHKPIRTVPVNRIRAMNLFKITEGLTVSDEKVYCLFKFEETGDVECFTAIITGFTEEMLILELKERSLRKEEIFNKIKNKIKEEINYGS